MNRYVTLPNGKRCGLGVYVKAWRTLLATHPDTQVSGFSWWTENAGQVVRELRLGMHDRINRYVPGYGKGRKWANDWQRETLNCARSVNTPRLVVSWVPHHLRSRLAHRLSF